MKSTTPGIPQRHNVKTQIRKEQIVIAALDVIAKRGVSELNMANVARRVGLVPSALYRHFRRKDQILDAILELIGQRLMENVRLVCIEAADPIDRLRLLLTKHLAMIRQNQVILRIVFSESIYGHHQAWRNKIQDILKQYLQAIADLLRDGQKIGVVRPDANPSALSVMFLGLIQPAAILWHISNGRFDLDHQIENAWDIFLRGIAAESVR